MTRDDLDGVCKLLRNGETVTLLCYEPEGKFCHRHLLKEYLRKQNLIAVEGRLSGYYADV